MNNLDRLIRAALLFEATTLTGPHANFDADLELAQESLDDAAKEYVKDLQ